MQGVYTRVYIMSERTANYFCLKLLGTLKNRVNLQIFQYNPAGFFFAEGITVIEAS